MNENSQNPPVESEEKAPQYPSEAAVKCLSARRKELGLTYAALAAKCGMSESTITKVLRGDVPNPTFDTIAPIARALEISLDTLTACPKSAEVPKSATEPEKSADLRMMEMMVESYREQIEVYKAQVKEKRMWNIAFLSLFAAAFFALAFVVLYDITHPDMGWIQYATTALPEGLREAARTVTDWFTV